MSRTDVIVIGAGQAGLATSRCLTRHGIEHLVIEAGRIAERWRSERWPSLRLLTPNWMTRLPDFRYAGSDPHGYMGRDALVSLLERYAHALAAPVLEQTRVLQVAPAGRGYRVRTDAGTFPARAVVLATGACAEPRVPDWAQQLPAKLEQLTPSRYRTPDRLPPGGVLVVGASATGVQLASELQSSGRQVTLAVGRHSRVPRRYRGRDIMQWLDLGGSLDRRADERSVSAADGLHEPSLQLVGSDDGRAVDLPALQRQGVRLVGRLLGADAGRLHFGADLAWNAALADARQARLLARIDDFCVRTGVAALPADPPQPFSPPPSPERLELARAGIASVLWATGFRRRYPWLEVPVTDAAGELVHREGVTAAPGLYAIGMPFLRTRRSTYLDGVGADADHITRHLAGYLQHRTSNAA